MLQLAISDPDALIEIAPGCKFTYHEFMILKKTLLEDTENKTNYHTRKNRLGEEFADMDCLRNMIMEQQNIQRAKNR